MLSGRRAFPGRGATEVMYKIVNEPPAGLETPEGVPGVPPAVLRVLRRALAKQPADRFPTARDFATALQAAFLGTGGAHRRPVEDDDRTVVRAPAAPAEAPQRLLRRAQMVPRAPRPGTLGGSRGAAASIAAPLAAPPAATGRQRSPAWDTNFLRSVEGDLATYVGPIARVLVRKAAEEASDVGVLYRSLAANIQDAGHRQQFLRRALHDDGTTRLAGGSATRLNAAVGTRSRLTPEALHSAERALTFFVGPIAKVLVRRIAQETASPAEFYARIQDYLPRDEEKAAFRREVRRDWDPLVR
jgi:serine/threonine-protein kinase